MFQYNLLDTNFVTSKFYSQNKYVQVFVFSLFDLCNLGSTIAFDVVHDALSIQSSTMHVLFLSLHYFCT